MLNGDGAAQFLYFSSRVGALDAIALGTRFWKVAVMFFALNSIAGNGSL
jgi:hypothetical protein